MQAASAPFCAAAAAGCLQGAAVSRIFRTSSLAPSLAPFSSSGALLSPSRRQRGRGVLTTAAALLPPSTVFDVATVLVMPFYLCMIAAPRKPFTQRLLGTTPIFAAGAALYGLILAMWNPLPQLAAVVHSAAAAVQTAAAQGAGAGLVESLRAALPSMPAFTALFNTPEVTVVAWVHLLLLDLLQARWVYQDGRRHNIPTWHSAILCFMVGPLGLLCHLATKALVLSLRGHGAQQEDYVVYRF